MIMYAVNAPPATGWEARTGVPLSVWATGLPNNYEQLILPPSWLEAIFFHDLIYASFFVNGFTLDSSFITKQPSDMARCSATPLLLARFCA